MWGNFVRDEPTIASRELWCAMNLGFFFTMRGAELENLRMKDIRFTYHEGKRTATAHISHSKTDQLGVGSFRTLSMTDKLVCPVASTADYLTRINWNSKSEAFLFTETVRSRLHALIKWSVSCNGLRTVRFGVHSLRSGGATACYVAGVPLDDIRRFGRWKSCVFHMYIHHDELMYHGLSRHIARTEGFLEQLKQTNSVTKAVRRDEAEERREFRTGRSRKEYARYRKGGNHTPSSDIDMESEEEETCRLNDTGGKLFLSDIESGEEEVDHITTSEQVFSVITREVTETSFELTPTVSRNAPAVRFEAGDSVWSSVRYPGRLDSPGTQRKNAQNHGLFPLGRVF